MRLEHLPPVLLRAGATLRTVKGPVKLLVLVLVRSDIILKVPQVCLQFLVNFHRGLQVLLVRRVFTLGFKVFLHLSELFTLCLNISELILEHHQISAVFLFNVS